MGSFLSRARGALVRRPLQRFDIDRRTEQILSQPKNPVASPKYAADADSLEQQRIERPDIGDKLHSKDDQLLQRLTQVYVKSSDPAARSMDEPVESSPTSRPLPERPAFFATPARPFDVAQSTGIQGKLPLVELERVLTEHQRDPRGSFSAEQISEKYLISVSNAFNLVRFFGIFDVFRQTKDTSKEAIQRKELETRRKVDKLLPGPDWVKDDRNIKGNTRTK